MTLTIELPDNQQAALAAKARTQGLSAEQYARQVLEHCRTNVGRLRLTTVSVFVSFRCVTSATNEHLPLLKAALISTIVFDDRKLAPGALLNRRETCRSRGSLSPVWQGPSTWLAVAALTMPGHRAIYLGRRATRRL